MLCCDDIKEAGNIIQYFHARIRLGEEVLILIDNLDNHFNKWNNLVQLLQSEVHCHYKLLITTRENDWYNYSEKKWANAQTEDGSMWVWIPRCAYKINKSNQTFDVIFLVGTTDSYYDKDGSDVVNKAQDSK